MTPQHNIKNDMSHILIQMSSSRYTSSVSGIVNLISETEIASKVQELAERITKDYKDLCLDKNPLVLVGILKGSYMFLADLSRALVDVPHTIDFMSVSSYVGTRSTGQIKINGDLRHSIENKHVLIIEDIVDSGTTLTNLTALLKTRNPASIECCAFLDKPTERIAQTVSVKYIGFELNPPQFVIGYGLDYNEHFRSLPFIGIPTHDTIVKYAAP